MMSEVSSAANHSRIMWALADVVGLFSINVGPFSRNVGRDHRIFSANVVPNRRMLSGRPSYVLGPLQVGTDFAASLTQQTNIEAAATRVQSQGRRV